MIFYRITVNCPPNDQIEVENDGTNVNKSLALKRNCAAQICTDASAFNEKTKGDCLFVSSISLPKCFLGALSKNPLEKSTVARFLETVGITYLGFTVEETTLSNCLSMLTVACRNEFVLDDEEILQRMKINGLKRVRGFEETVIQHRKSKSQLLKGCDVILSTALKEEVMRIFDPRNRSGFSGHPVHYMIESSDEGFTQAAKEILLSSLFIARRIQSCRMNTLDPTQIMESHMETLYQVSFGGMAFVPFGYDEDEDLGDCRRGTAMDVQMAAKTMMRYRNDVLTVFCLPKKCGNIKRVLYETIHDCTLISITEDLADIQRADQYLQNRAKNFKIQPDQALTAQLEPNKRYSPSELNEVMDHWLQQRLKTSIYPAYAHMESIGTQIATEKPMGSAYEELKEMIGLSSAKAVIEQAIDYYKAQKLFSDKGLVTDYPSMHMVFTGTPGTAKTTVARLFAQIMKDNGLLSVGNLYEVGRADLVGKYLGWTASIVKDKFRAAKGSVLFIDEAYSLLDDRGGLYGDEAINTIVQEMENNREDLVVIFAGYPDKMEQFLSRNPGLRSRIAFHVPFEDYSADELFQITELMVKKKGMVMDHCVKDKLMPILELASKEDDFGNGRFIRNIVEKAKMKQASRLLKMGYDRVTRKDVLTLFADDFEEIRSKKTETRRIGFVG